MHDQPDSVLQRPWLPAHLCLPSKQMRHLFLSSALPFFWGKRVGIVKKTLKPPLQTQMLGDLGLWRYEPAWRSSPQLEP